MPLEDPASVDPSALRVAWYTGMPGALPTTETIATTQAAGRALQAIGARVTEAHPPRLEEALSITQDYWSRPESMSASRWLPYKTATLSGDDVERHLFEWERFRVHLLVFMQD